LLGPAGVVEDGFEEWLVTSFSATGLIGAFAAPIAGKLIDRQRFRPVLGVTGVVSGGGLAAASTTDSLVVFVLCTGVGGAALAAFAFYHVTQTLAVRYAPGASSRSVGILTLWGAFASTIYLPLTAFLVEVGDWRSAMRVLAVIAGVFLVTAAVALPKPPRLDTDIVPTRGLAFLNDPVVRRHAVASFAIGIAIGIVLVYQVTIMTAAGLSLTTAAWLAGARGTTQFLGRLPVIWLVERVGSARGLQISYAAIGIGLCFLAFSGNPIIGFGYVLIGGVGIGALSPIQGIHAGSIFPPDRLGQGMGTITLVFGFAMALGPTAVAFASDGSVRWLGPAVAIVASAVAVSVVRQPRAAASAER
ncbi:MAG: MFS transporter, partial [Actinomycetota bacterium]